LCSLELAGESIIFIRGFRVFHTFKIFPKHLKAAAEKPDVDEYDSGPEPEKELISMPTATEVKYSI